MELFNSKALQIVFGVFLIHQITEKLLEWSFPLADNYLDPLLCMPIFLSLFLVEKRLLLKNADYVLSALDCLVITIVLAVVFEEGFPSWSKNFTKDYWDYGCYFVGGVVFYIWINKK